MSNDPAYEVRGRVSHHASGRPLPGLEVRAYDRDLVYHDGLGSDGTGPRGEYRIRFRESDFAELGERAPDVYLVVRDAGGRDVGRTEVLRFTRDQREAVIDVALDYEPAPGAPERPNRPEPPAYPPVTGGGDPGGGKEPPPPPEPSSSSTPHNEPPMSFHGHRSRYVTAPRSEFYQGPFGRLFRELPPWVPPGANDEQREQALDALAATMLEPPGSGGNPAGDNPNIPAGYTYFGQFVDHDITFDPTSSLQKQNDPDRLHNFRTPRFDLDNLYGRGPADEPFLYSRRAPFRFVIGKGRDQGMVPDDQIEMCALAPTAEDDLPRNEQGQALIGDPRNDENIIVSQLQLAFLKFHNAAMDWVEANEGLAGDEAFARAQTLVRWHYQWVVLHDFLKRIVHPGLVDHLLPRRGDAYGKKDYDYCPGKFNLCFYKPEYQAYMPVEFSVAAYRLGHSMVRGRYDLNSVVTGRPIFVKPPAPGPLDDLHGFRPLPGRWTLNWGIFLEIGGSTPQLSRRIDTQLARALEAIPPGGNALAALNLRRGWRMELPSGQAVARAMGSAKVYTNAELGLPANFHEAPLWFYILKEAELEENGERLGPVGGRIVAEVFVGLAKEDPHSFLNIDPLWEPVFPKAGKRFELRDILVFAGVGSDPFP